MHMTELLATLQDALFDWLVHGLGSFSGWQIVAYTLVTTHITIAAVTIFLHRSQGIAQSSCMRCLHIFSGAGSGSAPAS